MDTFAACGIIEGFANGANGETELDALQHLINEGAVWSLQGFYGRAARAALDSGDCVPPEPGMMGYAAYKRIFREGR